MKRKIKVLGMMALALGLLPLSACNPSNENTDDVLDDGDLVFDESGNIIYNNVELNLWSVTTGDDATTQDNIINEFNLMYKDMIHVTVNHQSRYDLETLLNSTMQFDKDNAPDALFNHSARISEYNSRKWLLPIEDYYKKADVVLDKDDFAHSLLNATLINNKMYGTPIDCHSAMMDIRVDILEKNNLKIPENYSELVEVAKKATSLASEGNLWIRGLNSEGYEACEWRKATTANPYTVFPISYGDMWVHEFAGYTAAVQNGAKLVNEAGMPAWNSEETCTGLEVLRDWIFPTSTSKNKVALSLDYGSSYDVGLNPFVNGNCIFKLDGPWTYEDDILKFDRNMKADGGSENITTRSLSSIFAKDETNEQASKVKGEGHALMLMSSTKSMTKRCATAVLADYLANYSGIEWAKRGHIPALKSVLNSNEYKKDESYDKYVKYWGNPEDYIVYGPTEYYSYCDTYFKQALQQSISSQFKEKSIKELVNSAYNDCKTYIELYA